MRSRLLISTALAGTLAMALPSTAWAEEATVVEQRSAVANPAEVVLAQEGQLPVSRYGGQDQARALVQLEVPAAATSLDLRFVEADDAAATNVEGAGLTACRLEGPFEAGQQPTMDLPDQDCSAVAVGQRDEQGTWTFDLSAFLGPWAAGEPNHGVSISPAPRSQTDAFRVVFDATRTTASSSTSSDLPPLTEPEPGAVAIPSEPPDPPRPAPSTPTAAGSGPANTPVPPSSIPVELEAVAAPGPEAPTADTASPDSRDVALDPLTSGGKPLGAGPNQLPLYALVVIPTAAALAGVTVDPLRLSHLAMRLRPSRQGGPR